MQRQHGSKDGVHGELRHYRDKHGIQGNRGHKAQAKAQLQAMEEERQAEAQ